MSRPSSTSGPSASESRETPLLATKFYVPRARPELVPRPRLLEQLAWELSGQLILLSGPAGFGKTTLLCQWLAELEHPATWLTLDADDNDPTRFLHYLINALLKLSPRVGELTRDLRQSPQPPPTESILTVVINELCTLAEDFVLVLDDYHTIDAAPVHAATTFLVDHLPPPMHLVMATRVDPPLPLARWRSRGQMAEIRADDLRFTSDETTAFLNQAMTLNLSAEDVATLGERTEGWIVGLKMAALSMRGRQDVSHFVQSFSGSHRYILDYLVEEILSHQPQDVQTFLLRTSILKRLTGPLCDAVLEQTGSQAILEQLEKANLFLVPLDDERCWYRYHHLFANLLRARLGQISPGLASQLHARAAAWLEQEGATVEAVNHALAAGAHDHAARMVEENTTRLLAQGEMNALMGWIETLPAELRLARPWLCVHQATALMLASRPAEVGPLLAQAEAALGAVSEQSAASIAPQADKTGAPSMGIVETQALKGAVAAVRAFTAATMGQDAEALSQAQQARELLPAEDLFDRSLVAWAIGRTMLTQGRLLEARLAFEEIIRLGRAIGHIWTLLAGLTYLAQVLQAQGQLHQARALLEEALAEASQQGARSRGFVAWMEDGLASVLYEQNELEAANRLLAEAIVLIRQWPNHQHLVYAYALQARVLLAQGNLQGALTAIGDADQIRRSAPLTRWLRRTVEAELVRVWLALQAAGPSLVPADPLAEQSGAILASWRSELANSAEGTTILMDECAEIAALTLARVSLAAGQAEEALTLLEPITRSARAAGHIGAAIASLILTAIAWQGKPLAPAPGTGRSVPALTALEEALGLAEPGDYVRVFLDEGVSMAELLRLGKRRGLWNEGRLGAYTDKLCALLDQEVKGQRPPAERALSPSTGPSPLVEPLSERELEILHLMASGMSNQEIAGQLYLATGTVKAHLHNVYGKLDVQGRTQAIARARELCLF